MKRLRVGLFIFGSYLLLAATPASALETSPYVPTPQLTDSPVIITAYSLANGKPGYVQLFNSSSQPVNLSGWQLQYVVGEQAEPINLATLSGWIAPSNYVVAGDAAAINNADFPYQLQVTGTITPVMFRLMAPTSFAPHEVTLDKDGAYQRKISTATGNYLSTFETATTGTLYGAGFYTYPKTVALQFSEILANPRTCSPLETVLDCTDYVKLYNPSTKPIDLSAFRLRIGYKGQSATSSNTYSLDGVIQPGHYKTVAQSADGRAVGVTNSGGYVWLEDAYGIQRYDTTVQSYEDASSTSKKGQAWAYDANDGTWKWTTQPTPGDSPSVFPIAAADLMAASIKTYAACRPDQYRSEETHRCRSLASSSATALKPCSVGQYRSPETNRCRNATTASSSLKPCAAGQERNSETNRCRKVVQDVPKAAFSVDPVTETGKAFMGWWALGGVGSLAACYGVWEWRREMMGGVRRVGSFFTSGR